MYKKEKDDQKIYCWFKESQAEFIRIVDIPWVRGYCFRTFLSYEIVFTSLFPTKNEFLSKCKSPTYWTYLEHKKSMFPNSDLNFKEGRSLLILCLNTRKIESWQKKGKVKTFGYAVIVIWNCYYYYYYYKVNYWYFSDAVKFL